MFAVNRHATVASVSGHVQTGRVAIVEPGKVETDGGVGEETGGYFSQEVESQTIVRNVKLRPKKTGEVQVPGRFRRED